MNFSFNATFELVSYSEYEAGTVLTFKEWPFTCQVSAVARALFNESAHSGTTFSLSNKNDVYLMG
jgi:uncharacterized membrane protein